MRTGFDGVADVEQDAVAGAGAGGEPDLRVRGDVVAVVRLRGALRALAVVAAGPEPASSPVPASAKTRGC
jgi:hypothetical protein